MLSLLTALTFTSAVYAQDITAEDIVEKMDANMVFESRTSTTKLTVIKGKKVKTYVMDSYGRGTTDSALEFMSPQRDKGTKMLKKGGELWLYTPEIEKTQKISGHMLRQGMMNSDFSYEDMMETTELTRLYSATLVGEELLGDVSTYKLELNAHNPDLAYPRRVMWVEKEKWVPLKQELYAGTGTLVKVWAMGNIQDFNGRWYPTAMRIDNMMESGAHTIVQFENMKFSVDLEDEIFERRWLER